MTPELKAFKEYKKNFQYYYKKYLKDKFCFPTNDESEMAFDLMNKEVCEKFNANVELFLKIVNLSYDR